MGKHAFVFSQVHTFEAADAGCSSSWSKKTYVNCIYLDIPVCYHICVTLDVKTFMNVTIYLPLSKNVNMKERCQMKLSVCMHENVCEAWIKSQETWLKPPTYL